MTVKAAAAFPLLASRFSTEPRIVAPELVHFVKSAERE